MKKTLNQVFGTSKRTILFLISAAALIAVLGSTAFCSAHTAAKGTSIGAEEAKAYAYADAGVDAADVLYVKTKFDYDDGRQLYEVDFTAGGREYEYEINAEDGSVIKKSVEILQSERSVSNSAGSVTLEDAKEIALTDAGLTAEDVSFGKTGLDRDNRTAVYDIEFYTAEAKYEYEISTSSGTIFKKSKEVLTNSYQPADFQPSAGSSQTTQTTAAVTLEQAKEIAAEDAGINVSDAAFVKAKQDRENGTIVYDIEFYTDTNKYEYEISASDGSIREKSTEPRKTYSNLNSGSGSKESSSDVYISLDEAKQIAAEKAGFSASEVSFKKAKLDRDDGITVYEIEFYSGRTEYEVTVNASNGNIIEFEIDD